MQSYLLCLAGCILLLGCSAHSEVQYSADELVDQLFSRALEASRLNDGDLDATAIGKPSQLAIPTSRSSSISTLRILPVGNSRSVPLFAQQRQFGPMSGQVSQRTPFNPLINQGWKQPTTASMPMAAARPFITRALADDEKAKIISIEALEVLDSRGNPTVEARLTTGYGTVDAIVPSGASTGIYEALEMRDGGDRYVGKGVVKAVENIKSVIAPALVGKDVRDLRTLDELMVQTLDGSVNEWGYSKSKLGANAILAVSMCVTRAGAQAFGLELYEYISELKETKVDATAIDVARAKGRTYKMPVPMMNVINGGEHAGNKLAMQEFMLAPTGATSFKDALQTGTEIYHALKSVVKKRYGKDAAAVGDEGGFAPNIQNNDEGLECLMDAIKNAGKTGQVKLAMDVAASEFFNKDDGTYNLGFKIDNPPADMIKSKADMIAFYKEIIAKYPIVSIEDPFDQDDWPAWSELVKDVGTETQIVGDDLLVTNCKRVDMCKEKKAANAMLLKINQIGTITESIEASLSSTADGWGVMVSHRSGETEDTFIADMSVGLQSGQIKTGAPCRSERVCKYNRLLRIEDMLGSKATFAGAAFRDS
eukprot:gnl/TRDRNA2_/TRDRNA2_177760_c0_seq1.p1 gnl/TRDRNA2_/TRDRNA2_177760_c0~~gnl/TRDRNA2_/TRDRNA2_177760_c0_seq1.p1  ORF type:complete len:594 (+),score=142.44 gnl/TRDRNA2_/TRDRNA2_177760_c0_seq1:72-1853(+)